ncbi:MAG: AtpZ/AtpI family protein [Crocinitomicaceae bacterium]|nr:AtpZ/AtpI family protein [Crocinitomicaceae bacterium]MDG1776248.1 AtpZ/AtpI family protein [Crocinitomicaceae bacterium]
MKPNPKKTNNFSKYARFSALGIQMGVIIGFFSWLGVFLDDRYQSKTGWWTIGLSLFGVTAALYLVIRVVIKLSKDK